MAKREPRQERARQRREALVDAAGALLREGGYAAVSHRTVADRAGVPLGATTYYFSCLDDLLGAAAGESVRRLLEHGGAVRDELRRGRRTRRRVAQALVGTATAATSEEGVAGFYEQLLGSARHPAVAAVWHDARPRIEALMAEILDTTGYAGLISANLALSIVDGAAVGAVSEGRNDALQRAVEALSEALAWTERSQG